MFSVVTVDHYVHSHVNITHNVLDLTVQGPGAPPCTGPLLVTSGSQDWRPVQTCSLEDLTVQGTPNNADIYWWPATEAHTVGERAVHILVECFLLHTFVCRK